MPVTRLLAAALAATMALTPLAGAAGLDSTVRPVARPMPIDASPRPEPRPAVTREASLEPVQISTANRGFQRWIQDFRARALAQGISVRVFDRAFSDVRYNADVISRDRNQSEFTKTIWDYLDSAASATRIRNGRAALREHARLLDRIEARYGVDKEVVVAVWGLESAYGTYRGNTPIIEALATLAYDGRRGRFFEQQLIAALKILQSGDTDARHMTGSWAGAMGHTQFIPTSYLAYAVDFTGDGRRDIWSDDPADALASTAAYLARFGWTKGQPWGVEVRLPRDFDVQLADRDVRRSPAQWAAMGVRDMNGRAVPDYGRASILLPAGARGAAFMIFDNFAVIERYNTADAYVIGVGHLSDRLKGGPAIQADWPRGDRALRFAERKELQERLTRAGFDTRGIDGKIGPNTIAAVRAYQRSVGLIPDGYASLDLLKRLR
ncbi:lytic murein transglycosylase [Rhodovulum adriaticum]|uniref:Membrane-bound lytic murein transglycosylase B n=1 Tax=Rhodovulum adriaticum TaxID=35804 RepID=A0A4V2SMJ1_RHOAD|nr:lytic murein transglycosylase [Rhodovulum adriaticum]MBK1634905.1 murein transglycosylase [Rhodovulum adriaticum]TCP27376.1 membrane-bound lytic murein transglycosylase B [Rhodovulum adriaticum]